jgi:putative membrane-bound dehydrogenase-like protein
MNTLKPGTSRLEAAAFAGWCIAAILILVVLPRAQETPSSPGPAFTVPPGFVVERVAGPPLVDRPIVADFDDEGRLYVADSSGSNDRVEKQLADRPHRIVRLEDTNADGRFDKSVVFADKMMLPEGTMWLDGSLYVAAPPSIWKLTDTNGDGVADQREEWFQGLTLTGCANDLHGPYLGPDGWIYWTKGAFAQQTYERTPGPALVTRAAHVLRRRPGHPAIEVVMTGGMDNPVDVAFTPTGERILTSTFVEHPQAGRRDGLIHAIYGGVYGKPHAVIDGHKRTGDLMPVMCELGPAVPAGLTRYASRAFGADYQDNFFAAMFNLRKVTRHALQPDGATFRSRDADFLVSENRDFHPTDVVEDADGSLLVVDTGPWYKLCCPTSQLAKPEVFGAIYRIRRAGAAPVHDPRGTQLQWASMTPAELTKLVDDPRPAVREKAIQQLAKAGTAAVPALIAVLTGARSNRPAGLDIVEARRNAVWALARIDGPPAREAIRSVLSDRDESVRRSAIYAAGLWRDSAAVPPLLTAVQSTQPAVQRAAAEALGRIGDARAVPALVEASASASDRVLEHSLTYALIEIGNAATTASAGLKASAPRSRRATLIALDQIDGGQLKPEGLVPLLDSSDPVLKDTAWWIALRHPEWGAGLAGFFERRVSAPDLSGAERDDLSQKLARFSGDPAVQSLVARLAVSGTSTGSQLIALRAMAVAASTSAPAGSRLKELPAVWVGALSRVVAGSPGSNDELTREAVAVVRAVPAPKESSVELQSALLRVARDPARAPAVRLDALTARAPGATLDPDLFALVRTSLEPAQPASLRAAAAAVVAKASLDRSQLLALAPALEVAGPLELPSLLQAFGNSGDEEVGLSMIAALRRSKARSSLRAEALRPRLEKYPDSVKKAGETLLTSVNADAAKEAVRLETLLTTMQGGDVGRGQTVFNGSKAACLSCHAIGYIGGRIGPDLTKIGQVRAERDLLEAVVYPSASFARGYEPVTVRTRSGALRSGVLRSDAPDELVLANATGPDTRIPRSDVADIEPGTVSLMPPGYADMLTRQELADLMAFLKAAK